MASSSRFEDQLDYFASQAGGWDVLSARISEVVAGVGPRVGLDRSRPARADYVRELQSLPARTARSIPEWGRIQFPDSSGESSAVEADSASVECSTGGALSTSIGRHSAVVCTSTAYALSGAPLSSSTAAHVAVGPSLVELGPSDGPASASAVTTPAPVDATANGASPRVSASSSTAPVAGLATEDQSVDEEFRFKRMNKALRRVLFDKEDSGGGSVPLHPILRFAREFLLSRQKST